MSTPSRPRGLGRGLDALLPLSQPPPFNPAPANGRPSPTSESSPIAAAPAKPSNLFVCPLEKIVPAAPSRGRTSPPRRSMS